LFDERDGALDFAVFRRRAFGFGEVALGRIVGENRAVLGIVFVFGF
jgi:hypothetical protein